MARQTIVLYLVLTVAREFGISFIAATYVMFLHARGLDLLETNLVNVVFFATITLCEIPTGVVADVFGRKLSFVASCLLFAIGMFVYGASTTFWGFALAEMISAIGGTCASGAFQAWLVDTLKHHEHTGSLTTVFVREHQLGRCASICGALCGAYLADINIAYPWLFGGGCMLATGIVAQLTMREVYFVREGFSLGGGWRSMKTIVATSTAHAHTSRAVQFVLLTGALQMFAVQAPNMQWQIFFSGFLEHKSSLGYIFTGISLALMLGATLAPSMLRACTNERNALVATQALIAAGIIATTHLALLSTALAVFLAHEVARGMYKPIKDAYLNDHIPSKERATLLSFESMINHLGGMIGLVASGAVAKYASIPIAWTLGGSLLLLSCLLRWRNGHN